PGLCIHLGVINRNRELHVVMVHPVKPFLHSQICAMRTASMIEPGSWIEPNRLHDEGVVIHPFANRVPVPTWLWVLGQFSPIRPDHAPIAVPSIQEDHLVVGLHKLDGPQFEKLHAREPDRITLVERIIGNRGGDLSDSGSRGLVGFECRQPQRGVRQRMLDTCLVEVPSFGTGSSFSASLDSPILLWEECRVFEGAVYLESSIQSCGVPGPRDVTARRGG